MAVPFHWSYEMDQLVDHRRVRDPLWRRVLGSGLVAGLASTAVLYGQGRTRSSSGIAPLNAPAHWLWGRESLRQDGVSARHTATGLAIHHASSLFWAVFYEAWLARRRPGIGAQAVGAVAVTAAAAVVDLKVVPQRLTPGFEHRLPERSLFWAYASFAAGLFAVAALRKH
jgi:uncharacterized membrane protein YccF (DUF307 family)